MTEKSLCEMKLDLIVLVAQSDDEVVLHQLKILLDEITKKNSSDLENPGPDNSNQVD